MNRPSHKELTGKIRQAKEAADSGAIFTLKPLSLASDAIELGYLIEDLGSVVLDLLNELAHSAEVGRVIRRKPAACSDRSRPPIPVQSGRLSERSDAGFF